MKKVQHDSYMVRTFLEYVAYHTRCVVPGSSRVVLRAGVSSQGTFLIVLASRYNTQEAPAENPFPYGSRIKLTHPPAPPFPSPPHPANKQLYGRSVGGDCDALRILSTDTKFYNLRGHGGNLDMMNTTVTSWDTAVNGVRQGGDYSLTTDDTLPRSYIR